MSRVKNIPSGWKRKRLEKVAIIQTGIAKNQNSKQDAVEIPYLRVANVQDGYLDLSEIKTINVHREKVCRYRLEVGDVLLTEGGDFDKLGRGTVWEGQIENCVHQNHVFAVRSNNLELLPSFLSAQTGSPYGKRYFLSCSKQSTNLASINSSQLKAFPVLLPPLPEQKAIADLLSTWDEAIEKTERLIQAKERRFRWLLRKLMMPAASPNAECLVMNDELKETQHSELKTHHSPSGAHTEWNKVKLGDVGTPYSGLTGKNKDHFGKGRPYLPYLNVYQNFSVNSGQLDYVKIDEGENQKRIRKGDVFFTVSSETPDEVGISSVLLKDLGECYLNSFCFGWRPSSEKLIPEYLQFYFRSSVFRKQMICLAQGATRFNLSKTELMKSFILFPPLEEQKAIAETLTASQQETDLLKQLADKYKAQKRGLMQRLLTGDWRIKGDIVKTFEDAK